MLEKIKLGKHTTDVHLQWRNSWTICSTCERLTPGISSMPIANRHKINTEEQHDCICYWLRRNLHHIAIQSSYWINNQVTLLPMVTWYKCNICPLSPTIREYLVFISYDMKHDYHVVHVFQIIGYGFLCHNRGIPVYRIVEFSDGCAAQFKIPSPFADISHNNEEFAVPIERHFLDPVTGNMTVTEWAG